jgi:hypothetical protein
LPRNLPAVIRRPKPRSCGSARLDAVAARPSRRGSADDLRAVVDDHRGDLALFPHLTVEANILYGARRLDAADRGMREIMASFQIEHLGARSTISGGGTQGLSLEAISNPFRSVGRSM